MDYEKKYKELIAKLTEAYNDESVNDERFCCVMNNIMPELKESDNEKIRKDLLNHLYAGANNKTIIADADDYKKWANWLEKQGEQKPTDLRTWKYIVDAVLTERNGIGQYIDSPWTEYMAKKLQKRFGTIEQKPVEWSEEDDGILTTIINEIYACKREAQSYEHKNYDRQINWLKSLRPQSTQIFHNAIELIYEEELVPYKDGDQWCFLLGYNIQEGICGFGNTILNAAVEFYKEYVSYKGSICEIPRPQKQWKPTEKQIEAVRVASEVGTANDSWAMMVLKELLKQLKAL